MNLNQIKNPIQDRFAELLEGVTDMPEGASVEQQIELLTKRLDIARKMWGYTNQLSDPAEKAKHRGKIRGFLNQMNPMLRKLIASVAPDQSQNDLTI